MVTHTILPEQTRIVGTEHSEIQKKKHSTVQVLLYLRRKKT